MEEVNSHTIQLEEDVESGDLVLPLSQEILAQLGWSPGDTLQCVDNQDGTWTLKKVEDETKSK